MPVQSLIANPQIAVELSLSQLYYFLSIAGVGGGAIWGWANLRSTLIQHGKEIEEIKLNLKTEVDKMENQLKDVVKTKDFEHAMSRSEKEQKEIRSSIEGIRQDLKVQYQDSNKQYSHILAAIQGTNK